MQAMFVPELTDTRFVIKPGSIEIAKKAASKHDEFMDKTEITDYESIIGLDYPLKIGITCREALMSIRSTTEKDKNLFVAVDEMWGGVVRIAYKSKFEEEARSLISVLPIYLDFMIGRQVWIWFTEDSRELQQSFTTRNIQFPVSFFFFALFLFCSMFPFPPLLSVYL